jgi:hypothetical protein
LETRESLEVVSVRVEPQAEQATEALEVVQVREVAEEVETSQESCQVEW